MNDPLHEDNVHVISQPYKFLSVDAERAALDRMYTKMIFILHIEQQPKQSRMSGVGEKNNRRPIDPPPVLSVSISQSGEMGNYLGFPEMESLFLFLQVTLVHPDTLQPVFVRDRESQMGALVGVTNTNLHRIAIPENQHLHRPASTKGIFAFTDLSVRQEGHYCLRFNLFEIIGGETVHRAEIFSDVFRVYTAKTFPGMAKSTEFTDILKNHGIRIRVSKSIRTTKKSGDKRRQKINANAARAPGIYPYDSKGSHRADRFRSTSESIFPPQPHPPSTPTQQIFLPPPVNSQSPTTPKYDRRFDHNYGSWATHDTSAHNDRRDHHDSNYSDRYYPEHEWQHNREPHENYGHHQYATTMAPPYPPGYLPSPTQQNHPYDHANTHPNQQPPQYKR